MMTSGAPAKYNSSIDCFSKILKNEGFSEIMNGVDVAILKGMFLVFTTSLLNGFLKSIFGETVNQN